MCSAITYYLAATARCGFESRGVADIHFGAPEYVGENHKVRRDRSQLSKQWGFGDMEMLMHNSFMAHPETLLPMAEVDDPVERFISVVKFYLSGWHIKPP